MIDLDSFYGSGEDKYEEGKTSIIDVMDAALELFGSIGSDLQLEKEDPSDPAFIDLLRDRMSDANVPKVVRDHVVEWCKCGCPRPLR